MLGQEAGAGDAWMYSGMTQMTILHFPSHLKHLILSTNSHRWVWIYTALSSRNIATAPLALQCGTSSSFCPVRFLKSPIYVYCVSKSRRLFIQKQKQKCETRWLNGPLHFSNNCSTWANNILGRFVPSFQWSKPFGGLPSPDPPPASCKQVLTPVVAGTESCRGPVTESAEVTP